MGGLSAHLGTCPGAQMQQQRFNRVFTTLSTYTLHRWQRSRGVRAANSES